MSIKYNEFGEVISVNGLTTGQHLGAPMQDAIAEKPEDNKAYGEELATVTRVKNVVEDKQPNSSGGVNSDWNQNDPNAPDYVKNRPFYTETASIDITIPMEDFEENNYDYGNCFEAWYEYDSNVIPVGGECKVIVNGTEYLLVGNEYDGGVSIGDDWDSFVDGTGEYGFVIYIWASEEFIEANVFTKQLTSPVSISMKGSIIHGVSLDYVPQIICIHKSDDEINYPSYIGIYDKDYAYNYDKRVIIYDEDIGLRLIKEPVVYESVDANYEGDELSIANVGESIEISLNSDYDVEKLDKCGRGSGTTIILLSVWGPHLKLCDTFLRVGVSPRDSFRYLYGTFMDANFGVYGVILNKTDDGYRGSIKRLI